MIPKIVDGRDRSSAFAVAYANEVRRLEIGSKDRFRYTKASTIADADLPTVLRSSLAVVGPQNLTTAYAKIKQGPESPTMKRALMADAQKSATTAVKGATFRHVQNGGRDSLSIGVKKDPVALGYVRVTKGEPCYFCAMLASRGLVYSADSFDESNARFTGAHNVKVHDSCACSLAPAFSRDSELLAKVQPFTDMWQLAKDTYKDAPRNRDGSRVTVAQQFRRLHEGRAISA